MSWRNQGITGSNNIPLGNRRRFGGENGDDGGYDPSEPSTGLRRSRSPDRSAGPDPREGRPRKRRNRWGAVDDNKAAGLMGLPTAITAHMTMEQIDAYVLNLRIEEISQKLRINDVVPSDADRSPSPPPQYDNMGRRVNTREFRYRKKLEDERHKLVQRAMEEIPNYHPPSDYRRPTKTQEKVYVPVNDYPEINFIGLLIGPRGNTLKKMEAESGAKIAIRGKGSVKEGKGRSDAAHTSNQEEDLHCLIMADTEDKVNKAKKLIHNIIETAASIPEGQNELKRNQLRELAALNGTLRDDENQACANCGEIGHRKYDCPKEKNVSVNLICRSCGNAGHIARDCTERKRGQPYDNNAGRGDYGNGRTAGRVGDIDREMDTFLQELGGEHGAKHRIEYNGPSNGPGDESRDVKPWQKGPTGGPAPWQRRDNRDRDLDGGNSAPWATGGSSYGNSGHANYNPAPWAAPAAGAVPPPPPSYGYNNYPAGGYDQATAPGYGSAAPMGAQGLAPPPGLGALFQSYGGNAGSPPPPPPPGDIPPPPPSDLPPPPPPA